MTIHPGLEAYSAIVRGDEPIDPALEFAEIAAKQLTDALHELRGDDGEPQIPKTVFAALAEIQIYLIALGMAADPKVKTARTLAFPKRPGRPRRSIEKIGDYRRAAYRVLELKPLGYDAALTEVAAETGLDRTEIEAWAAKIEADLIHFGLLKK